MMPRVLKAWIGLMLSAFIASATATFALPDCSTTETYRHNCTGTYTSANGAKYVGEFKDGARDGQGTYTSANGEKYVGEFKDGKPDGQGTYTSATGERQEGIWKEGEFQ